MASFIKNHKQDEEDENIYNFTKSARGYNPKEVNAFITDLQSKTQNAINNYEMKMSDYRNQSEMLECELEECKITLSTTKANAQNAINESDNLRTKLKLMQNEIKEVESLKEEISSLKAQIEKINKEKDEVEHNLLIAQVDKKDAREKLEAVKKEFSEAKNEFKNELEKSMNDSEYANNKILEEKQKATDDEIQRIIGAYTIHLKKTKQLVETLQDQLNQADNIF